MSVSLTNFVQVNIKNSFSTSTSKTRDTAVILNYVDTLPSGNDYVYYDKDNYSGVTGTLKTYCDNFFNNSGQKLLVIYLLADQASPYTNFLTAMKHAQLDYTKIVVTYCDSRASGGTTINFKDCVEYYESQVTNELYRKIFVTHVALTTSATATAIGKEYYVAKCGSAGIEGTVLAYLTNIKITDTIEDYAFTAETVDDSDTTTDNDLVRNCINNNYNVCASGIANKVRNIGGNDTAGKEIVNQFMLILVNQTVTEQLVDLIATKIRYNTKGIASIISTISYELNKYVNNGFLTKEKSWEDNDLIINDTTIISKGTALINGYKIVVLPFTQEATKTFPNVYIILGTSTSIRFIKVDGEAL